MARRVDLARIALAGVLPHAAQCGRLGQVFRCRAAGEGGDFRIAVPVGHDGERIELSMKFGSLVIDINEIRRLKCVWRCGYVPPVLTLRGQVKEATLSCGLGISRHGRFRSDWTAAGASW